MAAITIRKIDEETKDALKELAARDGRSLEGYVRNIIYEIVRLESDVRPKRNLALEIHNLMSENKAYLEDGEIPDRQEMQREVDFR